MNHRSFWTLLKRAFEAWNNDDAPRLGAALAFYTVLSLAPLVILVIAIASLFLDADAAKNELLAQVRGLIGTEGAETVETIIASTKPASGAVASVLGLATLLFGASGVFGELRSALNKILDVQAQSSSGIRGQIRLRFFSFGMVLAIGFLLLVSLLLSAVLATMGRFFGGFLPVPEFLLTALNFGISFASTSVLFALIFRYVPERRIAWAFALRGGAGTALLFSIGKLLIGLYLGKAAVGSAYGAAGSLIVVIVWVYYSAMIFLFGAEFTHTLEEEGHLREKTG